MVCLDGWSCLQMESLVLDMSSHCSITPNSQDCSVQINCSLCTSMHIYATFIVIATVLMQSYKLDMFVHTSAIQTLRDVASGSTQSAPMLAVCCEESADGCIRLAVYNDTYEGEANEKPLKVDTFVTVKKALPPPNQQVLMHNCFVPFATLNDSQLTERSSAFGNLWAEILLLSWMLNLSLQDDVATVSSLASAFQAACNTSSLPRLCHLLPMELTAALCNPTQLLYPPPAGEPAPRSGPSVQLSGIVLQPNVSVSLTQLHRMKVLQCMLSARLMHGVAEDEDERFRSGLLSIEQSRSLVPLLYADPMVWLFLAAVVHIL